MFNVFLSFSVYVLLFALLWVGAIAGYWVAEKYSKLSDNRSGIVRIAEGTIFALLGLLIAFSVTSAYDRFQERKMRIIEEVNAIETVYQRIGLLPTISQPELHTSVRQYLDARIKLYGHLTELNNDYLNKLYQIDQLRKKIWRQTLEATSLTPSAATVILFVPAINNMFEIFNTRTAIRMLHIPPGVFVLLVGIAMLCSFVIGFAIPRDSFYSSVFIFGYVIITSFSIYIIFELEFPRSGLVRLDKFDHLLVELQSRLD